MQAKQHLSEHDLCPPPQNPQVKRRKLRSGAGWTNGCNQNQISRMVEPQDPEAKRKKGSRGAQAATKKSNTILDGMQG